MSNSQWSNEQPPAWEGRNAPAYNPEQLPTSNGWKPQRLSVLLGLTWGLFSKNAKKFLATNFLVVGAGAIATLIMLRVSPIELTALSQGLLDGNSKLLEDALAQASTVEDQTKLILDAVMPLLAMYVRTIPFVIITSLLASAFATKTALAKSDETSIPNYNWLNFLTASLGAFAYVFVGIIPIVVITLLSPDLIFIGLLLAVPYFVWIGLGLAMLYPVVMSENIGGIKAVKRAFTLSRGNRKTIFALTIIVGILASLPGAAINQFMLLIPSSVLNYVEVTSLANFASMLISVPITTSGIVILYRYLHAKFHN